MSVDAATDFRSVLHRWALDKLETARMDHTGPFEVLSVRVDHDRGGSLESESINVMIQFRHPSCQYRGYDGNHPCPEVTWWSPLTGTTDTVTLLNELLALGDPKP